MSKPREHGEGRNWINWFGLAILVVAYAVAIGHMLNVKHEQFDPDRVILRFTHWQLEKGIREGLDVMARRFEQQYYAETGEKITVIQQPISERAYRQYIQTHCIGRDAPDLIEIGFFDEDYMRRFFLSNSEDVQKPNPYNKGTPLEGVPWADTFIDGMRGALDPNTLEYYGAGLATITHRLFYNKKLFREVLGTDAAPRDYKDFLRICATFQQWAAKAGRTDFVPIAGARYQLDLFKGRYIYATTMDFGFAHDLDYAGDLWYSLEGLDGYATGAYDFTDPAIRAGHELLWRVTSYFPPGFMALDRMESGFRFTQGKAAFIVSGTYDAMSYFVQSDFPVGVVDLPLPARTDPEFGRFIHGQPSEAWFWAGLRFGITKFSKHPDIALKFLQFMTNPTNNQDFNRICKWIPLIRTAKVHPSIEPFMPNPHGFWGAGPFGPMFGARCSMVYDQELWDYVEHKIDYDTFAQRLEDKMPAAMAADLERVLLDDREQYQALNASITLNLAGALFAPTWGMKPEEAERLQGKATRKVKYLWESRPRFLTDTYWLCRWKQHVADGQPRAKEIQAHVALDLDREVQ
jgi:raffinose/stachyose/melibiose transport system substrate-binding protein